MMVVITRISVNNGTYRESRKVFKYDVVPIAQELQLKVNLNYKFSVKMCNTVQFHVLLYAQECFGNIPLRAH